MKKNDIFLIWESIPWGILKNPIPLFYTITNREAFRFQKIYFSNNDLPPILKQINEKTISILSTLFATQRPENTFYTAAIEMLLSDPCINQTEKEGIKKIIVDAAKSITQCLATFGIHPTTQTLICRLLLTTLPGWALYLKEEAERSNNTTLLIEYLSLRATLLMIFCTDIQNLIAWHEQKKEINLDMFFKEFEHKSNGQKEEIIQQLKRTSIPIKSSKKAEIICCIDPREISLRKILESLEYKTYSYAGFFGLPIIINNKDINRIYKACPIFVEPKYTVYIENNNLILDAIPFQQRYIYAHQLLMTLGLSTINTPYMLFIGHEAELSNYPTIEALLHCGACGYNPGIVNARIITMILNDPHIRAALRADKITFSQKTICIAAEHNTNTSDIVLFLETEEQKSLNAQTLYNDIAKATQINTTHKLIRSGFTNKEQLKDPSPFIALAGTKGFIIGPQTLINTIDNTNELFMHSYEQTLDPNGDLLHSILTGALQVVLSINTQYILSTLRSTDSHFPNDLPLGIPQVLLYDAFQNPQQSITQFVVVIYASESMVALLLKKESRFKKLLDNQWISLVIVDPSSFVISTQ